MVGSAIADTSLVGSFQAMDNVGDGRTLIGGTAPITTGVLGAVVATSTAASIAISRSIASAVASQIVMLSQIGCRNGRC